MVINRVGPMSCAKITGVLYAILGLVIGCIFSVIGLAGSLVSSEVGNGAPAAFFSVFAIVLFPIMYGMFGFVGTLIAASLYNALAGAMGGVELEVE